MTTVKAILNRDWANKISRCAFVPVLILAAICTLPIAALAQEFAAPAPSSQAGSFDAEEIFQLRPEAQEFKFSKADLDLLKQVDAFDKYIEDKGWVYSDSATDEYINRVGHRVIPPNTPEKVHWRFRVIRDPMPNAFALPNGSIYVHSGLLSRLENEAQLAGVLAHEVTHVFNRHTYLAFHEMRRTAVAMHVLTAGAAAAGFAGGMNFWMANVVGNMLPLIAVEVMFGYHRELEHEADVYGVRMLNHAGYAPAEMAHALELLEKGPEVDLSEHSVFWADHPKLENRVKYTMELARQLGDGNSGKVDRQSYEAATQKVIVHDARLAMMLGRPRTTVAVAKRLVDQQPSNAEYQTLLGDGYRALGGRTAVPEPPELTDEGKDEARHMVRKMTLAEYDKALLEKPEGKIHWKSNCTEAEHAYHQALAIDSADGEAHRGLGYLYDSIDRPADAVAEFKRYLGLAPDARDARVIRMRLDALEKKLTTEPISKGGNS